MSTPGTPPTNIEPADREVSPSDPLYTPPRSNRTHANGHASGIDGEPATSWSLRQGNYPPAEPQPAPAAVWPSAPVVASNNSSPIRVTEPAKFVFSLPFWVSLTLGVVGVIVTFIVNARRIEVVTFNAETFSFARYHHWYVSFPEAFLVGIGIFCLTAWIFSTIGRHNAPAATTPGRGEATVVEPARPAPETDSLAQISQLTGAPIIDNDANWQPGPRRTGR